MDKIEQILQQMTLEDKIALCSGESFWETKAYEKHGIPALFLCDGPHGLRKQERGSGADMLGVNELWNVTQNVSFHLVGEMPSSPLIPTVSPIF